MKDFFECFANFAAGQKRKDNFCFCQELFVIRLRNNEFPRKKRIIKRDRGGIEFWWYLF